MTREISNDSLFFPYYYDTNILIIDDDIDYSQFIKKMLNNDHKKIMTGTETVNLNGIISSYKKFLSFEQNVLFNQSKKEGFDSSTQETQVTLQKARLSTFFKDFHSGENIYSVIVVDYSMPEISGLELIGQLKGLPIKKILLTGTADEDVAIDAFNKGLIDCFIHKSDPEAPLKVKNAVKRLKEEFLQEVLKKYNLWMPHSLKELYEDKSFASFLNNMIEKYKVDRYFFLPKSLGFLLVSEEDDKKYEISFIHESYLPDIEIDAAACQTALYPIPNVKGWFYIFMEAKEGYDA